MEKVLFVDDLKDPEMYFGMNAIVPWAKDGAEALKMWTEGDYDTVYLDNDLGWGPQGYKVLESMIEIRMPKKVYGITYNPVAMKRMMDICKQFGIKFEAALTIMDKESRGMF